MKKYILALAFMHAFAAQIQPLGNKTDTQNSQTENSKTNTTQLKVTKTQPNPAAEATSEQSLIADGSNILRSPAVKEADNTWTVYEKPSLDTPSKPVIMKSWTIETDDWYRITDEDNHKSYWIHKDELAKKNLKIHSITKGTDHNTQSKQVLSYQNKNSEEKNWEAFDKQFEEMLELQQKYMKAMREKTLTLMPTSHPIKKIGHIRYNFISALSDMNKYFN